MNISQLRVFCERVVYCCLDQIWGKSSRLSHSIQHACIVDFVQCGFVHCGFWILCLKVDISLESPMPIAFVVAICSSYILRNLASRQQDQCLTHKIHSAQ